jgi:hypothetical protein
MKGSFYKELERVFDKFPKYHMEILLRDFNAEESKEDIFKPIIGNESLHEISNDNGVRILNFATSKNLTVKSTMFPHRNIHKVTWWECQKKRSLGRLERKRVDNIKMDFRETE